MTLASRPDTLSKPLSEPLPETLPETARLTRRQQLIDAGRRWPGQLLKLLFSLGMLIALFAVAEGDQVLAAIASAHWLGVLAATLVAGLGVVVVQALEIHHSLAVSARPSRWSLMRINLAMMLYSCFLPSGLTVAIRWAKYRALGLDGWHSAALVGVHKLLQLMMALGFLVTAYLAFPAANHPVLDSLILALSAALLVLIIAFGWLGSGRAARPQDQGQADGCPAGGRAADKGTTDKGPAWLKRGLALAQGIAHKVDTFRCLAAADKRRCLVLALMQQLCVVTSAYLVLVSIAPDTPWLAVMMVRSLLVILLVVPVSVAGIGVRELVFFSLFPFYGVSAEDALAGALVLFGIQLLMALLGAVSEMSPAVRRIATALRRSLS